MATAVETETRVVPEQRVQKERILTISEEASRGFPGFKVLDRIETRRGAILEVHTFLEGHQEGLLVAFGGRLQGECINNGWCPEGKETHIIERKIMPGKVVRVY